MSAPSSDSHPLLKNNFWHAEHIARWLNQARTSDVFSVKGAFTPLAAHHQLDNTPAQTSCCWIATLSKAIVTQLDSRDHDP
jgi:hypothetical protein